MRLFSKSIFWILLLALVLRLWGISYGFPLFLVNDETPHVYGALKMIELKTLVPAFHQEEFKKVLYYPPLISYALLPVVMPVIGAHWLFSGMPPLAEYKLALALDPSFIWLAARIFIALVGVLDVAVIYLFARRIFQSERAGVFAALFAALSFYHLQLSHNVRHWLPAGFLLTLAWLWSVPIFEGRASWRRYAWLGALVGAAAGGVNTAAVIGLIPPFFASIFRQGARGLERIPVRKIALLLISFAVVALVFVALYPYGFTRAEGAVSPEADIIGRFLLLSQKSVSGLMSFWGTYIRALWDFETPLLLAGLLGAGLFLWRGRRFWALTALIYAFSFFTLLYLFDDYTVRGIVFIIPLLAAFAGYAADEIWRKLEIKKLEIKRRISNFLFSQFLIFSISAFLISIFFGWQFVTDLRYDWLLAQDDTRLVAVKWIDGNLPSGSRVVMDSQSMRLTNTKEGIRELQALDSSALRAADSALLSLPDERYPAPAYGVVNLNFISSEVREALLPEFFRQNGFQYAVVEYTNPGAIAKDTLRVISDAKLIQRFSQWKEPHEQSFDGSGKLGRLSIPELFQMERFGLFVDIYESR